MTLQQTIIGLVER